MKKIEERLAEHIELEYDDVVEMMRQYGEDVKAECVRVCEKGRADTLAILDDDIAMNTNIVLTNTAESIRQNVKIE